MKQIDQFDSLQHLNFSNSAKEKREKVGSFLLTVVGILGLLAINNPTFHYSNSGSQEGEKVNKFWLTPTSLNAEKTAFESNFQTTKAGLEIKATNSVASL